MKYVNHIIQKTRGMNTHDLEKCFQLSQEGVNSSVNPEASEILEQAEILRQLLFERAGWEDRLEAARIKRAVAEFGTAQYTEAWASIENACRQIKLTEECMRVTAAHAPAGAG